MQILDKYMYILDKYMQILDKYMQILDKYMQILDNKLFWTTVYTLEALIPSSSTINIIPYTSTRAAATVLRKSKRQIGPVFRGASRQFLRGGGQKCLRVLYKKKVEFKPNFLLRN